MRRKAETFHPLGIVAGVCCGLYVLFGLFAGFKLVHVAMYVGVMATLAVWILADRRT